MTSLCLAAGSKAVCLFCFSLRASLTRSFIQKKESQIEKWIVSKIESIREGRRPMTWARVRGNDQGADLIYFILFHACCLPWALRAGAVVVRTSATVDRRGTDGRTIGRALLWIRSGDFATQLRAAAAARVTQLTGKHMAG